MGITDYIGDIEETGKLHVSGYIPNLNSIVSQLAGRKVDGIAKQVMERIFCFSLRNNFACYGPNTNQHGIAKAIVLDQKIDYSELNLLKAIDKGFVEGRLKVLDNLSLYGSGRKTYNWDSDELRLLHEPVEGAFYVSSEGKVVGHARADIRIPFHKGDLTKMIYEQCARHNLFLSERGSYHGRSKQARFVIKGEMDMRTDEVTSFNGVRERGFHKPEDLLNVPRTVYTKSRAAGFSLHEGYRGDVKTQEVYDEVKPLIDDAVGARDEYRKIVENIMTSTN